MKTIKIIIMVLGIIIGGYYSLYVMLYGGIVQIINAINPLVAKDIALGILRIIFCEVPISITSLIAYLIVQMLGD